MVTWLCAFCKHFICWQMPHAFFKAPRVRLHICACVRMNCTSLGVVNMLWECQCLCVLVCVWACLVPHMCESVPLLGKSAARLASWHRAPLAGRSLRTARPSWSGHLSLLWRRVAELTEEREEEESAKAAQEQRAGAGHCPPQQDETLSQEISAGSERKHCCVLTRTRDFLWMSLNIIFVVVVVALSAWKQTHILHFPVWYAHMISLLWPHDFFFYLSHISSSTLSDTGCVSICPNCLCLMGICVLGRDDDCLL